MKAAGHNLDVKTVDKYINLLTQSYIIYEARRLDLKGKEILRTQNKYYVVDTGLRHFLMGSTGRDAGHIMENIVYLELLRRYPEVYIGKTANNEIDFVAINGNMKHYYQVSLTVLDDNTFKREITPLQQIRDSFPKTILTTDEIALGNLDGIEITNLFQWLLE